MILDHIGIIVTDLDASVTYWAQTLGYSQRSEVVVNTRQDVKVVFVGRGDSLLVKLVQPGSPSSPIAQFAKRGGGLHHLCFRCNAIDETITILEAAGAKCIVKPEPGEAFNNHDIAMLLTRDNLLIELIDTTEKATWIRSSHNLAQADDLSK